VVYVIESRAGAAGMAGVASATVEASDAPSAAFVVRVCEAPEERPLAGA
jgi:hypothetical protein